MQFYDKVAKKKTATQEPLEVFKYSVVDEYLNFLVCIQLWGAETLVKLG
jgi:hypothetical protein